MNKWSFNNFNNCYEDKSQNNHQEMCNTEKSTCDCKCSMDYYEDNCPYGFCCPKCPAEPPGPQGPTGETGPAGCVLNYADFYALMPSDNTATVAPGTDVSFPQDVPNSGADISRTGPDSFNLAQIGTYQILFEVSVDEAGQLILTLDGEDLAYTVVGRATGASQIVGMAIVTTTTINSILTVRNPAGNATALTITPLAGGTRPVSAHLVTHK